MSVIHTPRKPELDVRTLVFPFSMLGLLAILFFRLWYFQVVKAPELVERAEATRVDRVVKPAPRGLIFDRNGELVAGLKPEIMITGVYQTIAKNPWVIDRLAALLKVAPKKLSVKVDEAKRSPGLPVPIFVGASPEVGTQIAEAGSDLPGIGVDLGPARYYPDGKSFAHVLGYVRLPNKQDIERLKALGKEPAQFVGKGGIERAYETDLMGQPGDEMVEIDAKRRPLRVVERDNPVPGNELVLSLDAKLQREATQMMAGKDFAGAIVAVAPKSGEVLCMVSAPTFDQNLFQGGISTADWDRLLQDPNKPMMKRFMETALAPGSTFKLVTSLAAYDAGKFDPNRPVDCEGGFRLAGAYFRCLAHHGDITYHEALVRSCNTYFADLGYRSGERALRDACAEAGLGQLSELDIAGERPGVVPTDHWLARHHKKWYGGDTVNFSIGQGYVAATPLQMCDVAAMVANQGVIYRPHLVKEIRSASGALVTRKKVEVLHDATASPEFWSALRSAMIGVIEDPSGTAHGTAAIPGLVWAGKTGSAEHGLVKNDQKTHGWFVGFAPAEDPKIAICVMVESAGHGGEVAAPIAQAIVKTYLSEGKVRRNTSNASVISASAARSPNER